MKKNAIISAIVLTIGIIFTSCGDVYNYENCHNTINNYPEESEADQGK